MIKDKKKRRRRKGFLGSSLGIFILALIIGALAAALAGVYIKLRGDAYLASLVGEEKIETTVVVASADLPKGTIIGERTMSLRPIPIDFVHEGAITPAQFESVKGKVLIQPMSQGTALLRAFMDQDFGNDFSDTIDIGRRAITMQVDDLNAIGGMARPGNRIDIFVLLAPGVTTSEDQRDMVIPVLQDVLVLATGQFAYKDYREKVLAQGRKPENSFSNITVDISPRDGALLSQAIDKGNIITLLRNREDRGLASFAQILPVDLVKNATRMVQKYQTGKKLIITEDGVVMTKDGRVLEGVTVTKDGFLIDAEGNIMTQDGVILEGVSLNENGEVVTVDGRVLKEREIVVNDDGSISIDAVKTEQLDGVTATKDESLLDGATLTKDGFYVTKDGKILTKDGYVLDGVSLNENGEVVTVDGRVLKESEIVVNDDGSISIDAVKTEQLDGVTATKDESLLDGATLTKDGFYVTKDGKILTKDGYVLDGLSLNENGEVVTKDGKVLKADEVVIGEDGSVSIRTVDTLEGVRGVDSELSQQADLAVDSVENLIEFIAGGSSEGGKAKVSILPVLKD